MRQRILQAITQGNIETALILLWLWAESADAGCQRLSVWRQGFSRPAHELMVGKILAALEKSPLLLPTEMLDLPLAIIEALDRHAGLNADLPGGLGGMHKLEEGDVGYWLVRRRPRPNVPADNQEPNLEKWFRHFRVIPDRIVVGNAPAHVELIPVASRYGDEVRVFARLSHFDDGVRPNFSEDQAGESFWAEGLSDYERRLASLQSELETVKQEGHGFWVAPELTIPPAMRRRLQIMLAEGPLRHLLLAVPGSFHEIVENRPVNGVDIFDGDGVCLARHEKLTLFSYPRARDGKPCCEAIHACRKVVLLETPLALVGVAICKDFSDKTSILVRTVWERLAPDWLLVPSMGDDDTLRLHETCAQEHAKLRGMRSCVANQQAFADEPKPGFACDSAKVIDPGGVGGSSHIFSFEIPGEG